MENLPADYFVTNIQFTKRTHHDVYPAIDRNKNESISLAGKTVIITGASRGIGAQGIVPMVAKAGPKAMVLVATKAANLKASEEVIHKINPKIKVLAAEADLSDASSIASFFEKVKDAFGYAHLLINNAGVNEGGGLPHEQDDDAWFKNFDHTRGVQSFSKYFVRALPSTDTPASIITLVTGGAWLMLPYMAGYALSKLATLQATAYYAASYPNITAVSLHPGLILSDMLGPEWLHFDLDSPELVGGVIVWLSSDQAAFISGKTIVSNWDVEDLAARQDEIKKEGLLEIGLTGKFGKEQFESVTNGSS